MYLINSGEMSAETIYLRQVTKNNIKKYVGLEYYNKHKDLIMLSEEMYIMNFGDGEAYSLLDNLAYSNTFVFVREVLTEKRVHQ